MQLTSVGSFPRRKDLSFEEATRFWVQIQEGLGYDILVHGEQERADMVAYFGDTMGGFTPGTEPVRSYGNRFWIPPLITAEVHWKPLTVASWTYAQSLTDKPMKGMLTGPGTIYDWSIDVFYGKREKAMRAIAQALRKEIQELIEAGAKYIQIDEPSLAQADNNAKIILLREVFVEMLQGLDAYFIMHTCYGTDIFEKSFPELVRFPVQNLDIETSNSNMEILEVIRKNPSDKDYSIGVVDVHDHSTEKTEVVLSRIKQAIRVIPEEKLWIDPDCGLKTRSVEETIAKLKVIADARALL